MHITANGTRIELDGEALRAGFLKAAEGVLTDQCDGCGADIFGDDAGRVSRSGRAVKCPKCGQEFEVLQ